MLQEEMSQLIQDLVLTESLEERRKKGARLYGRLVEAETTASVAMAVEQLTLSERKAIQHILLKMGEHFSTTIISTKLAEESGITRSSFINALRKLENGNVLTITSLGMRGLHIKFETFFRKDCLSDFLKEVLA